MAKKGLVNYAKIIRSDEKKGRKIIKKVMKDNTTKW